MPTSIKDERDSAPFMPKARVVHAMPLVDSQPSAQLLAEDRHLRGACARPHHAPSLRAGDVRGTFAAISSPAMIADHLHRLGITAIEFMPVHAFAQDRHLRRARACRNYWGYNTLAFFAPEPRYLDGAGSKISRMLSIACTRPASRSSSTSCTTTPAEGNHLGPTLSWRGIDNASYYRLLPDDPRYYDNLTGCGNAMNTSHPRVLQMVLDSLRFWVTVYGIDGFRFDLAADARPRAGRLRSRRIPSSMPSCRTRCWSHQAHRRALGSRPRRLPARRLSRRDSPNGTATIAMSSGDFWSGDGGTLLGLRRALRRLQRPLRRRAAAARGRA